MMMPIERLLVIKLKHIGDVLLTTPVFTALKEAWPGSRVTALVPQGTQAMVTGNPALDEVLVVDRARDTWGQTFRLLARLRQARYDLVLELSGGDRGACYTWLTRAPRRLGFDYPRRPGWQRRCAFTRLVEPPSPRCHTVEQNLALVRALGLTPQDTALKFYWPPEVEATIQTLLMQHGLNSHGFAVMHPPARWLFKTWTVAGYAALIDAIQEEWQLPVVLTAGPDPRERQLLADIIQQAQTRPIDLGGRLSLKELGALMAQSRFFFGVDSAPLHLAAAVGTPAVGLFGPTGEYNWRPWGPGHLVITKDMACRPCGQDGCDGSKVSRCLTELTPAAVLDAMRPWLPPAS